MDGKQRLFLQCLQEALDICSACYCGQDRRILYGSDMQDFFDRQAARERDRELPPEPDIPYLRQAAEGIYFWVIWHDQAWYFIGPVATIFVQDRQLRAFSHEFHIRYAGLHIPRFHSDRLVGLMKLTLFGLFGICPETEVILQNQRIRRPSLEEEAAHYELEKAQAPEERNSYAYEQLWLQTVENGETYERGGETISLDSGYYGILSRNSDYKQMEYMAVSSVTLATRAAIRGGVQPDRAYALSDLFLQRLSDCDNILQIGEIMSESARAFPKLVQQSRQTCRDEIVELCSDYIAKHLYHSFTIGQMARELGIARSYMSGHFSAKAGQTLREYILSERLNAAANLLKYSQESVAQISDYMQFSSPGRFAGYFKKRYGCSPSQYRRENKVNEFIEKNK